MMAYSGHIMTLANSIIGVGILAMPFCFQKCGIVLSVILLIISNWITCISCHYLIKSSLLTRRKSLEFLGFHAFGASGKLLAELCIIGYLFGTSITYFVVLGDLGPEIASKILSLNIKDFPHLRTWVMISVTLFCILPLAMLKNVDSLSAVCAASIGFYVCLVLKIVFESEEHIVANDWIEKVEYWRPAGVLQCLPIFSMAQSCQMQLFEVFESINNQSVEKLNGIVRNATWICTFVYIGVGYFGYVAFCTQTFSGNILINFTPSFGSDVIKIGFLLSVAFSFPLVIFPCRASLYSLLYRKGHADNTGYIPEARFKVITSCLVGFALCIALIIPSVELIIGLVGSTIGVAICIMFPALCFRKIVQKDSTERTLAQFIYIGGFCLMILGTVANLNAIDERRSGAHLNVVEEKFNDIILTKPTKKVILKMDTEFIESQRDEPIDVVGHKDKKYDKSKSENRIKATPAQSILKEKSKLKLNKFVPNEDNSSKVIPPNPVSMKKQKDDIIQTDSKKMPEPENLAPNDVKLLQSSAPSKHLPLQQENILLKSQSEQENLKKLNKQIQQQNQQQQTIDKDAIRKDEDIAAEELKNVPNSLKSKNDAELKETQKELKQTKKLLEQTFDQLKQELAKQNEETQNLVVEKLEKVVQKVEQIEKKVIQNESEQSPISKGSNYNKFNDTRKSMEESPFPIPSILLENQINEKPIEQNKVYEPLSYKTGELIKEVKNGSKIDQSLPRPLAVLFNASNIQINDSKPTINESNTANTLPNIMPNSYNNDNATKIINATSFKQMKRSPESNEKEKENVEAIRRDILHLNSAKVQNIPLLALSASNTAEDDKSVATNNSHLRHKRSSMKVNLKTIDLAPIYSKFQCNGCLSEPKMDQLVANGGISNAIDFKMQNFGRELRSVNDETQN